MGVKKELIFLKILLLISVLCVGGFHIFSSAALTLLSAGFVIYKLSKKDAPKLTVNLVLITLTLVTVSYLFVSLWAVDSGTAIYGFIKYLPIVFFSIAVGFYTHDERRDILSSVPLISVTTGYLSFALSFVPKLEEWLLVAERLGGFFQSPNIFATFSLVGLVILITSEKLDIKKWILIVASIVLIFLSGSRTVFILLALVVFVMFFKLKSKKTKIAIASIFATFIVIGVIVAAVTDSFQTFGRFLTISVNSSTFLGRLLYFKDAIPVIFKNPFGMGYYGYYFSQGSFQTGVYSVAFVHNTVLQFLLDIGFIPTIFFCVTIATSFFSSKMNFTEKFVLAVIFVHSLVDFDLQFITIFFVLILTLDFDVWIVKSIKLPRAVPAVVSVPLVLLSIYFAVINLFFLNSDFKMVEKIYGNDTMSKMYLLQTEEDGALAYEYANYIADKNGYLAIAYDYKANSAFVNGDFEKVIEYKTKALECSPYDLNEYLDYLDKLYVGISLYYEAGDYESAQFCITKAKSVPKMLAKLKKETSSIAWKIQDKPQLELPEEYKETLKELTS
ncbi:MAG: O-antigen ligase family protein [Clostridia bacterium]|nr:O-antigen ligase family protein [Clostridia bacterium]